LTLKIILPKNLAKILAFFAQTTASFSKNCDHNIDPRLGEIVKTSRNINFSLIPFLIYISSSGKKFLSRSKRWISFGKILVVFQNISGHTDQEGSTYVKKLLENLKIESVFWQKHFFSSKPHHIYLAIQIKNETAVQ
jgi:hypothetical protein